MEPIGDLHERRSSHQAQALTRFLLTGGMSFFAPRYGFACDNVENFEVVLAGGKIVNANARVNRDLWFALKGGSNNFGIVTRFDLRTLPQREIWCGTILSPIETR